MTAQSQIFFSKSHSSMKEMLYEVRCLKSNEDMILALAGQFKQLSHEPEKFILLLEKESGIFPFFFSQNSSSSDFLCKTSAQIESFRFEVEKE